MLCRTVVVMTSSEPAGIVINFTLTRDDGDTAYVERRSHQVPRIGELVTFDPGHSYQVVDVLWHYDEDGDRITIHASELNWHAHYDSAQKQWDAAHA